MSYNRAAFACELETIFGDLDQVKHATEKLITLWMNKNQCVHQYTVAFKEYANKLRWADDVLHPLYYQGLPDHIKDLWAQSDPLPLFTDQAQQADLCYWHCINEKKKTLMPGKPSTSKQKTSDQKPQSSTPAQSGQSSRFPSLSTPNKTASTLSSMLQTPAKTTNSYKDLSAILGLDSKLLPEEKEWHKKFGLCLHHIIKDDCLSPGFDKSNTLKTNKPASTPNMPKPKGHVAQAENTSDKSGSKLGASADALDF